MGTRLHFTLRRFARSYYKLVLSLAIIGLLAVILLLYVLLVVQTGTPTPVQANKPLYAGTPEFMATLAQTTHSAMGSGGNIVLLNNGEEFVPDAVAQIDAATSTINFSTYIWQEGAFSSQVLTALTRAANRGVMVRLLLDGVSGKPPKEELIAFVAAGGKVGVFHDPIIDPLSINNRTHRRAITFDSTVGYTGGIAVSDYWLGDGDSEDEWRDTMYKVEGSMVRALDAAFADQWLVTTGEVIVAGAVSDKANESATSTFVNIVGSAGDKNRPIAAAFLLTALSAQKSLYISNPYVLPERALRQVLIDKAQSGVQIHLLVPGPTTDQPTVRLASQQYYRELLDAGVHIYEYQPSLMHEKVMVADGVFSLVGSANIDNRSAELNDENLLGIYNPAFGAQLIDTFYADLQSSVRITPEAWRNRNIFKKIGSWIVSIPYKQY